MLEDAQMANSAIRCTCGQVRGEADLGHAYTRGTCHCHDCQAYARWLGRPELMDAAGGTDIVPMSPADIRLTAGVEHLACMSLSEKGTLRWYAACCRTPLGNTARSRSCLCRAALRAWTRRRPTSTPRSDRATGWC